MNETLLTGIVLAILWTEFTDLSPGGIIVPAYFALYFDSPRRMAGTIFLAFLCLLILRFLSGYLILYGRRRYAMFLLTGGRLKLTAAQLGFGTALSIGSLIPGILARDMERQKILPTLLSLGAVTMLTRLAVIAARTLQL